MGTAIIRNAEPTVTTPFVAYSTPNTNPVNAGGKLGTANHIAVFPFNLPYPQLVTNIVMTVGTAGGAASNYDIGIYSISGSTGTLVAHIGAQVLNTTGTQILAVTTPITLQAGTYLIAITGVAVTLGIRCAPVIGGAGTMYVYDTNSTSTGGALPGTISLINTTPTDTTLPAAAQWSFSGSPPPLFMLT
jgi:hypothetical protein